MTREIFIQELEKLNADVVKMGTLLEDTIQKVQDTILGHDTTLAQEIIKNDDAFDDLDREIEIECIRLIAKQSPVATDLRKVAAVMHIIIDLERIADNCSNIARCILEMPENKALTFMDEIKGMFSVMKNMVREAVSSFISLDKEKALNVIRSDDIVDEAYDTIKDAITALMEKDSKSCMTYLEYIMVIRHIERMSDHATNIAEWVSFIVSGELVEWNRQ